MKTPLGRRPRIVLVDDDPGLLRLITIRLRSEGFEVAACENASQALTTVPRFLPDVLVTDLRMKDKDGISLLKELQGRYPALPVILLTAHGTIPDAVTATKSGAFAFLTKPVEKEQLLEQISAALKVSGFASVTEDWRAGIITRNPVMEERLSQALMAASSDAPLLITGQPGTGKAQLARAIHQASARRGGRFLTLSCVTATQDALQAILEGRGEPDRPAEARRCADRHRAARRSRRPGAGPADRAQQHAGQRAVADHLDHRAQPAGDDPARQVPRGPLLSPEREPHRPAAALAATRRRAAARGPLPRRAGAQFAASATCWRRRPSSS